MFRWFRSTTNYACCCYCFFLLERHKHSKEKGMQSFFRSFSLSHLTSCDVIQIDSLEFSQSFCECIYIYICMTIIVQWSQAARKYRERKKIEKHLSVSRSSWNCTDKSLCHLIACNTMPVFVLPFCNDSLCDYFLFFFVSSCLCLYVCALCRWIKVDAVGTRLKTVCLSILFARVYSAFCSLYYADWNEIVRCYCVGILMVSFVRI